MAAMDFVFVKCFLTLVLGPFISLWSQFFFLVLFNWWIINDSRCISINWITRWRYTSCVVRNKSGIFSNVGYISFVNWNRAHFQFIFLVTLKCVQLHAPSKKNSKASYCRGMAMLPPHRLDTGGYCQLFLRQQIRGRFAGNVSEMARDRKVV